LIRKINIVKDQLSKQSGGSCHARGGDCVAIVKPQIPPYRHSGLDPGSIDFSKYYTAGCRIKSGMTTGK
jgi:hypothetical protein